MDTLASATRDDTLVALFVLLNTSVTLAASIFAYWQRSRLERKVDDTKRSVDAKRDARRSTDAPRQ